MSDAFQAAKALAVALVLSCLIAACGARSATPPQPVSTTPLPASPSPAVSQPTAVAPTEADLTALLTQVRGDVTVAEMTGAGEGTPRRARPMQVLRAGAVVRVPSGGQAGLICSTEQWIDLSGELDWQVTEAACDQGRDLPAGTYQSMSPQAGRILSVEGSMVVEPVTREKESDYGRIPIVVSPRNTSLLELEPELRWVEVPGAIEYVLSMSGPQAFEDVTLDAEELSCEADALAAPHRICSATWPASEWRLDRGGRYFLTIGARTGVASAPRPSEESDIRVLAEDTAGEVQTAVTEIEALNLDVVTQDLLLAGLYAGHGLYGQATAAYERILALQPSPVVYVTLGDTYSATALYRWAFEAYQEALDVLSQSGDEPAVHAAAEFGIGRVYYNYAENYAEAAKHFAEAVQLYEKLEADEWLQAAQRGLEEARKRLP